MQNANFLITTFHLNQQKKGGTAHQRFAQA